MKWDMTCSGQRNEMKYEIQCAKNEMKYEMQWINEMGYKMQWSKKWNGIWNTVCKRMKWNMK